MGNELVAVISSLFMDADHFISYTRHTMKPNDIWYSSVHGHDPFHDQRGPFHSVFVWAALSGIIMALNFEIGSIFCVAYLGHLLLDAVDSGNFHPFRPFSNVNIKGPVPYNSPWEWTFALLLLLFVLFY